MTVEGGKRRSTCSREPGWHTRRERERWHEIGRERTEEGQSDRERGPGASPPGLLLREGGSSESIRTVSPADTHPRPPHPLSTSPSPVALFVASFVAPLQADLPPSALLLSFLPFFLLLPRGGRVGGSTPEAGAAIFISLLPSISTSSFSSGFSFRLLHPPG